MTFFCFRGMGKSALFTFSFLLFASSGCFNEPEPAYKSVPAEARVYLSEKGLADLHRVSGAWAKDKVDYLNLDRNKLTNVDEVVTCPGLKWLRLNSNRLSALPDLKPLASLRRIYLKNNDFTSVPETLRDLPSLTDVDLSGNPISEVPQWLVDKPGIKNISLSRTRITALPANLDGWKGLTTLQLGELKLGEGTNEMSRIRAALPSVAIVF